MTLDDYPIIPISLDDPRYPTLLKAIKEPPPILYCRGNTSLLNSHCVAVVGTRESSPHGREVTARVTEFLMLNAEAGYTIVAGLALGIDTVAHQMAVDNSHPTIAVLTNISSIWPRENTQLALDILHEGGLLCAEHPPQHRTERRDFFLRDRIQSGLSVATIPIQAGASSGTLHTANSALEQGRLLFCPLIDRNDYQLYPEKYQGIKSLIKSGKAQPFNPREMESVIEAIGRLKAHV